MVLLHALMVNVVLIVMMVIQATAANALTAMFIVSLTTPQDVRMPGQMVLREQCKNV
jgi:hypothetical protein